MFYTAMQKYRTLVNSLGSNAANYFVAQGVDSVVPKRRHLLLEQSLTSVTYLC